MPFDGAKLDRFGNAFIEPFGRLLREDGASPSNIDFRDMIALSEKAGHETALFALPYLEQITNLRNKIDELQIKATEIKVQQKILDQILNIRTEIDDVLHSLGPGRIAKLKADILKVNRTSADRKRDAARQLAQRQLKLGRVGPLTFPVSLDPRILLPSTKAKIQQKTETILTQAQAAGEIERMIGQPVTPEQLVDPDFRNSLMMSLAKTRGVSLIGYEGNIDTTLWIQPHLYQEDLKTTEDSIRLLTKNLQTVAGQAQHIVEGTYQTAEGYNPVSRYGAVQEDFRTLSQEQQSVFDQAMHKSGGLFHVRSLAEYKEGLLDLNLLPSTLPPWQLHLNSEDPRLAQFGVTFDLRLPNEEKNTLKVLMALANTVRKKTGAAVVWAWGNVLQDPNSWQLQTKSDTGKDLNISIDSPALHGPEGIKIANAILMECQKFGLEVRNEPTLFLGKAIPILTSNDLDELKRVPSIGGVDLDHDAATSFGEGPKLWRGTKLPDPFVFNRSKGSIPFATPYNFTGAVYAGAKNNQRTNIVQERTEIEFTNAAGQIRSEDQIGFLSVFKRSPIDRPEADDLLDYHVNEALVNGGQLPLKPKPIFWDTSVTHDTDTILCKGDDYLGGYLKTGYGEYRRLDTLPPDLLMKFKQETNNLAASANFRRTQELNFSTVEPTPLLISRLYSYDEAGHKRYFQSDIQRVFANVIEPSENVEGGHTSPPLIPDTKSAPQPNEPLRADATLPRIAHNKRVRLRGAPEVSVPSFAYNQPRPAALTATNVATPVTTPVIESDQSGGSLQRLSLSTTIPQSGLNVVAKNTHSINGHIGTAALVLNVADELAKGEIDSAAYAAGETVAIGTGQKAAGMAVARIVGAEAVPVVGQAIGAGFAVMDSVDAAKRQEYGRATYSGVEATLYGVAASATVATIADCWNPTVVAPAAVALGASVAAVTMTAARTAYDSGHAAMAFTGTVREQIYSWWSGKTPQTVSARADSIPPNRDLDGYTPNNHKNVAALRNKDASETDRAPESTAMRGNLLQSTQATLPNTVARQHNSMAPA